ncbi:hypothetical protein AB4Z48_26515 [Cupriavidus sp. 2TAF22]|uniref:OB-fold protein n=1 Tax=unclassified Cupriavidus TaxID=2640874 RepID=UPI003F932C72
MFARRLLSIVTLICVTIFALVVLKGRHPGTSQPENAVASGSAPASPDGVASQAAETTQHTQEQPTNLAPPVIEISAAQLYQEYKANEVLADTKYKGNWLYVSGVVAEIGKDFTDAPYLRLLAGQFQFDNVRAMLGKSATSVLAQLHKGNRVSVMCLGRGMLVGSPVLDCTRDNVPPRPQHSERSPDQPSESPSAATPANGSSMPPQNDTAAAVAPVMQTTSFDCLRARSEAEHLICTDAELAREDVELAGLFRKAKTAATNPSAFKERTRQAWNDRERNCHDKDCLVRWYVAQKAVLSRIAETGEVSAN